jgi:nitrate/nitrite transporter NarK
MSSLTPSQTVLALAFINMAANFGGFVGNYVIGALKQATGNYYGAVWMMGAIMVLAACLVVLFPMSWAMPASQEGQGEQLVCDKSVVGVLGEEEGQKEDGSAGGQGTGVLEKQAGKV